MNGRHFSAAAASYVRDDIHWGSDLDVLKCTFESTLNSDRQIEHLDIGCGTGFHAKALHELYPESSITGLDFSPEMLSELRKNAFGIKTICADITLDEIDIGPFNVVSFLNNGFGNLYRAKCDLETIRKLVAGKLRSLLKEGGVLVLSVYHRQKFSMDYGPRLRVLPEKSDISAGDLQLEYISPSGVRAEYYSHWFTRGEIEGLLQRNGFEILLLEERMARLVIQARAI